MGAWMGAGLDKCGCVPPSPMQNPAAKAVSWPTTLTTPSLQCILVSLLDQTTCFYFQGFSWPAHGLLAISSSVPASDQPHLQLVKCSSEQAGTFSHASPHTRGALRMHSEPSHCSPADPAIKLPFALTLTVGVLGFQPVRQPVLACLFLVSVCLHPSVISLGQGLCLPGPYCPGC